MSFPQIKHPTYDIKVPGTSRTEKFRPFLVREEKLLLTARESGEVSDILKAMKQVVQNCALSEKFNIDAVPLFTLEYMFLKLRAHSVDSIVHLSYRDAEDDKVRDFDVDLMGVEVEFPEKSERVIEISDGVGLTMKYPSAALYSDAKFLNSPPGDYLFELILRCVESVHEGDTILEAPFDRKEFVPFLENLSVATFDKIQKFLTDTPRMRHVIVYVNDLGHERKITLESLQDFFTL